MFFHTYLFLRSILERCILEALLRRVLYCGHSTQYSHLVIIIEHKQFRKIYTSQTFCESGFTDMGQCAAKWRHCLLAVAADEFQMIRANTICTIVRIICLIARMILRSCRWFTQIRFAQIQVCESSVKLCEWSYAQSELSNCPLIQCTQSGCKQELAQVSKQTVWLIGTWKYTKDGEIKTAKDVEIRRKTSYQKTYGKPCRFFARVKKARPHRGWILIKRKAASLLCC